MRYLRSERRAALGGYLPARRRARRRRWRCRRSPATPDFAFAPTARRCRRRWRSCACSALLRDKTLGPRIVPIVADEARTFGMANLFRQVGIYSPVGQLYEPEDAGSMLFYREAKDGQLLEEGITEAGALSSWVAAATSYSVHGIPMLPFYIYYSMFGFQRVGDLIWAAADQRARGFLIGATAGARRSAAKGCSIRTAQQPRVAATVPNCRAYDPASPTSWR
jgi:pyruvate dehydrogenase E1 component